MFFLKLIEFIDYKINLIFFVTLFKKTNHSVAKLKKLFTREHSFRTYLFINCFLCFKVKTGNSIKMKNKSLRDKLKLICSRDGFASSVFSVDTLGWF